MGGGGEQAIVYQGGYGGGGDYGGTGNEFQRQNKKTFTWIGILGFIGFDYMASLNYEVGFALLCFVIF